MKNALFTKDGKWFLIPELLEKPEIHEYDELHEWHQTIANALPVANPELIPVFPRPHVNGFIIPKNFKVGEFYQWPGTFEVKDAIKRVWITNGRADYNPVKKVAVLILPTSNVTI